jgi:thiol-disulfide isomerase/thioredoxin
MEKEKRKKYLYNGIFIVVLGILLFVPSAKAVLIQGLMKIGLFSPDVNTEQTLSVASYDVKFKAKDGTIVGLNELQGKVVFLNFWATWCPPCLAEMPAINKLYEQYKDQKDVQFILLDADSDFAKSGAYMQRNQYNMPLYQMAGNVPEQLFSGSLPTTVVFDKKGRISFHHVGTANYHNQKFIDFVEKLRKQSN